jgi:signal transduction histidine kinase
MNISDSRLYRLFTGRSRFRVALFTLFALCVLAISLFFISSSIGRSYIGISLSIHEDGWIVESMSSNGLAREAGIVQGDKPVEINGQPAESFLKQYGETKLVFGAAFKELTVIGESGQVKSVVLAGSAVSWETVTEQTILLVVCFIFWITGFYVVYKRPESAAAALLCISALFFGLALSANMAAEISVSMALQLEIVASIIGPWVLLHFFIVLPDERSWSRSNFVYLIYVPAIITLILFPVIGYSHGQPVQWFRTARLLVYGAGFLGALAFAITNYFRAGSVKTRQQMKIVLIGCLVALVPFLILYIFPEAIWRLVIIPHEFSILFVVFIPLAMGYAVVTQRLLDIDFILRRGLVYALVTIIMAGILSAGIFTVLAFRDTFGVPEEVILALALAGIATALFGPIKNRIEIIVDKFLYKDRYDYRKIIQSLSASLHSPKDFTDASRLVVGTLVQSLNLAGVCLLIEQQSGIYEIGVAQGTFAGKDEQKNLLNLVSHRNHGIEFPSSAPVNDLNLRYIIPLVAADKEVGVLCLSEKTSRQQFSTDDMYLLQGLASVAAVSLRSAMLIRDVSIRDTFVSIASHELRTPLTSIMGYAEILLKRNPPEDVREQWLHNIVDSGQQLTDMVDNLLNVTRIQSGKLQIKPEPIELADVFGERLDIIREVSDKHEICVDIEPGLSTVLADREKFGQVVGNLLSNAVKYSPEGGHITLAARRNPENSRVVVSVSDEGIGIGPEDKDSLFTTFHRIQRSETKGIKGSGLGLYIAKEWIEAMGGEIWLESELNKGSTFFVTIPVYDSDSKLQVVSGDPAEKDREYGLPAE